MVEGRLIDKASVFAQDVAVGEEAILKLLRETT